jgi:NADPH-dependent ferric siderophore reductase
MLVAMPERRVLSTTVRETTRLTPEMVRIVVDGDDLEGFGAGPFTDHYVKCKFGDRTRSYTVRDWDPAQRRLTLDFVVHGDHGVAGPWAARAQVGDTLEMMGPGGAYTPDPDADWHLMVGDDAVIPAIAASLGRVPAGVPVFVVAEVSGPEYQQTLETPGDLRVTWLHRSGGPGEDAELQLRAVQALDLPAGRGHAFVHGEASAVRALRRHLVVERGMPTDALSASGYWKLRRTDEQWRSEKRDWLAQSEQDLAAAGSA